MLGTGPVDPPPLPTPKNQIKRVTEEEKLLKYSKNPV